jgi:hypothetical protein
VPFVKRVSQILTVALLLSCTAFSAEPKEMAATSFAKSWLLLVDDGKYDQCWKETSASFQSSVRKDKWHSEVAHSRHLLGKLHTRKLISAVYSTQLPGADDGEYVVVTFESGFERLGSGVETVTTQLESDGSWKISGYMVKPVDVTD